MTSTIDAPPTDALPTDALPTDETGGDGRRPEHHRIIVVGTGFAGLGTAIRLRREGYDDFVVLERGKDVGGTWRDNSYPGCACDVPSNLYSFSFAPNPEWSRTYSGQAEIFEYLRTTADRHGVRPLVRHDHEVLDSRWVEADQRWHVETSQGPFTCEVLVLGSGALSEPAIPTLHGIDTFEGPTFHSATWDHDVDLTGKRVAVVGTGASAIQFVPAIQPQVASLALFQRTPPWVLPRPDRAVSARAKAVYRRFPMAQKAVRAALYARGELSLLAFTTKPNLMKAVEKQSRDHMAKAIADPALLAKVTPSYRPGCKRLLISNDYYPALAQPNVEVITDGISEVRAHSVVDTAGVEHEIDVLIYGTGFHVTDNPMAHRLHGRDGRTAAEVWDGSPNTHLGTMNAGFPNLFQLAGPNTGIGHTSLVYMIERQLDLVVNALRLLDAQGAAAIEPTPHAQAAFNADVDRLMEGTVWTAGGCNSWYLDRTGRNSTLWPTHTFRFAKLTKKLRPEEYTVTARRVLASR